MTEKKTFDELQDIPQPSSQPSQNSKEMLVDNETMHPVDFAEQLELLTLDEQVYVLENLPADEAADALAELDDEMAGEVLESLNSELAAAILAEMSPDDAVDVLDEVGENQRDTILNNMNREDAEELRELLTFDPETAAGIMNTELLLLPVNSTPDEVIKRIRSSIDEIENFYYVYLVDEDDVLCGVLSLRDLMRLPTGIHLKDHLATEDIITAPYDMDRKDVAYLLTKYGFLSLPVVDREGRVLGVITHDDIIDIIHDEASADMLGMVGAGQDEDTDTPWLKSVKMRLPWLVLNMFNSSISASIVYLFEGSIAEMAILAVLMPIVANQSGNTGQQSLAVMIRQLAMEKFDSKKSWKAVFRESKIGIFTGFIMAILAFCGVFLLTQNMILSMVMGLALATDMILGAIFGGSIPLILRSLGRDPAQASSIFLTTITDSAGFFIFLGLATLFLF